MDKKTVEEFKKNLEKERSALEGQLKTFATKDEKMKGDWDTKFPKLDNNVSGSSGLETAADEVEEYNSLLPVEYSLELRLQKINVALKRIGAGTYGKCENCKKDIPLERLKVSPESTFCLDCGKK
jgi:DnaK suppressor protein